MTQSDSSTVDTFHRAYLQSILDHETDDDAVLLAPRFTTENFSQCSLARSYIECRDFVNAFIDIFATFGELEVGVLGRLFWSSRNPGRYPNFMSVHPTLGGALSESLMRAARACGSRTVAVEHGELIIQ